jgi:hypothetical protein
VKEVKKFGRSLYGTEFAAKLARRMRRGKRLDAEHRWAIEMQMQGTNIDHLEKAEEHGQSREPASLLLDDEGELLDASVVVGVSRDRVPALGRQRLPQVDVVGGAVGAAAANL